MGKFVKKIEKLYPIIMKNRIVNTFSGLLTSILVSGFASTGAADSRIVRNLNDGWTFKKYNDSIAVDVHLPHCWNAHDAYETKEYYRGKGIYSTILNIPKSLTGKSHFLKLDGAATSSEIMIDGKPIGGTIGAYSSHTFDITPFSGKKNDTGIEKNPKVTIVVDNSRKDIPPYSADFSFMGGLYRDVWLISTENIHLDITNGTEAGFDISSILDSDRIGSLKISGNVNNDGGKNAQISVAVTLYDPKGNAIRNETYEMKVAAESSESFIFELDNLENLVLWKPESPHLYKVTVEISDGNKILDSANDYTAFRSFGFDGEGRFLLNGDPYKLRGICRHQDRMGVGIALADEEHRRDILLAKEMGANFIRISHYPQDDALLEMCDRVGLIAWEEIPVIDFVPEYEGFADNAETMLLDMIRRHRNHPSIIMWGFMNEILLRVPHEEKDATWKRTLMLAKHLEDVLKSEDPSRMSAMAFHGSDIYHEAHLADITDVKGWNLYQGWYGGNLEDFPKFLSRQHRDHPEHRIIVSEYGAGSDRRLHSLDPRPFDFSVEYQQKYLESYLPVIEDSAFIAGASHWNLIDFSSANRAESMPHINNKGILTNEREKKDVFYYFASKWHDIVRDTVAHIAVDDWRIRKVLTDAEGIAVHPVKVYTNLPQISMSLSGIPLGVKDVKNCTAVYNVELKEGRNILTISNPENPSKVLDAGEIELEAVRMEDGMIDLDNEELAVNVGSSCWFRSDESGMTWLPDKEYLSGGGYGYIGGSAAVSQDEIRLTKDQPLLQTCRKELESYRFDVVPGEYEIEMLFAELSSPSEMSAYMLGHNAGVGEQSIAGMDIAINGEEVEQSFIPGNIAGAKTMVKRRYKGISKDNGIDITFSPNGGITQLTAIKIRKL